MAISYHPGPRINLSLIGPSNSLRSAAITGGFVSIMSGLGVSGVDLRALTPRGARGRPLDSQNEELWNEEGQGQIDVTASAPKPDIAETSPAHAHSFARCARLP